MCLTCLADAARADPVIFVVRSNSMTPSNDDIDLCSSFIRESLSVGNSLSDISNGLKEHGFDMETIEKAIALERDRMEKFKAAEPKLRNEANRKILRRGIWWLAGGLVFTGFTYIGASGNGGVYFVATGAIIYGLVQVLYGFFAK